MKNRNTFCRHEKKFLIDTALLPDFRSCLSEYTVPDRYCRDGQSYELCNLYFDTPNNDLIRQSVAKPPFKEKIRLRSYGTPYEQSPVFLEVKRKLRGVGTKRRAVLPLAQMRTFLEDGTVPDGLAYVDEQVLRELSCLIDTYRLSPKVYIGYLRQAFYAKDDPELRITFDSDILSRRDDLFLEHGRYGTPLLPEGKTLTELKFSGAVPFWLASLMGEFSLSFCSFSKYGEEYKDHCRNPITSLQENLNHVYD